MTSPSLAASSLSSAFLPLLVVFVIATAFLATASGSSTEDLYAILGVSRTATTKQIKSAYRRKALDTHPDKNKDVPPEEAAAEFHKVVHAFEVLSDAASRRRYDGGGGSFSSSSSSNSRSSYSNWSQFFQQQRRGQRRTRIHLKDKFEVKQAQSRVIHIVSLDQLRTIMTDDDDRLERHLLLCFFTPAVESVVNEEIVYPYPFAGMSPQSIWWEDLLQTVSIRFHRSNELTRYFNLVNGDELTEPAFVFAKKGAKLSGESVDYDEVDFFHYTTNDRQAFETWVWSRMEVKVIFHNRHAHPAEMHWLTGNTAHFKETIEPNSSWSHYSMLTHQFWSRDARVDTWPGSPGRWKLTENTSLGSWKIGVEGEEGSPPIREDGTMGIIIPNKECIDLSGHCTFWQHQNQCDENPGFMREKCMLTCGHCSNEVHEEPTCDGENLTCEN
mmetsp:Transcript_37053/g.78230  ORF Transcript_37053/g.78230 Transcript_37053/m.78230 type:complete len:442 (-) Transcript_37053:494-1819(-)